MSGSQRAGRARGGLAVEAKVEDRPLTDQRVLLRLLPRALGLLEDREHALARGFGGTEGAALDQRFDRLLVDRPAVHAGTEVPQIAKRSALFPRALDRLHRCVADALDGVEAETDVAVDDDELVI